MDWDWYRDINWNRASGFLAWMARRLVGLRGVYLDYILVQNQDPVAGQFVGADIYIGQVFWYFPQ